MIKYLIDENLPSFLPVWNQKSFTHVLTITFINLDSDIWEYALNNNLVIITKDSDFYFRYLSSKSFPKIVWVRTGNIKKNDFNTFIESIWKDVEQLLIQNSFIVITEDNIQCL